MGTLTPRGYRRSPYGRRRGPHVSDFFMPLAIIMLMGFMYMIMYIPSSSSHYPLKGGSSSSHSHRNLKPVQYFRSVESEAGAATVGYTGTGRKMPCNSPCQGMELDLYVQDVAQRQFCIRQYYNLNASVPAYLAPLELECHTGVKTDGPEAYHVVKLYGYVGHDDKVSRIIRKDKRWENEIQRAIARMMKVAQETRWPETTEKEDLFFIDIGGNVGAHTMCVSSLGYSTIVFEPLLANEIAIRSAVCENDMVGLVTLIPKGLGEAEQICQIISDTQNIGDGVTRCNNPSPPPIPYEVRGSFEMVTLDQALYCPYRNNRRKIVAVKIDVESQETFVIRGGRRFFEETQVPLITYENGGMTFDRRKEILEYFLNMGYYYTCIGKGEQTEVFHAYTDKVIDCWDLLLYHPEFVVRGDEGTTTKKKDSKYYLLPGL